MKHRNRLAALMLALSLGTLAFTACQSANTNVETSPSATEGSADTSAVTDAGTEAETNSDTVADTEAETEADTAADTEAETEDETTADTEAETETEPADDIPEVMKDPEKAAKITELLNIKHELRVDENGKFKVLVLSDVQFNTANISKETLDNIKTVVSRENPDLVIFNGDNSSGLQREKDVKNYLRKMTQYLEENQIPWAHVFGNHDAELWRPALDKESQQAVYESFDYCVSKAGDEDLFGVGNFVLPVLEHDSDKIAFNIWCFDSGTIFIASL